MRRGACTPEELETLLEDAFVTRDAEALSGMFSSGAVLVPGRGRHEARGEDEIKHLARTLWEADRTYLAASSRVVQARDTALVVGSCAINVVRREADGGWRYAISLLSLDHTTTREET